MSKWCGLLYHFNFHKAFYASLVISGLLYAFLFSYFLIRPLDVDMIRTKISIEPNAPDAVPLEFDVYLSKEIVRDWKTALKAEVLTLQHDKGNGCWGINDRNITRFTRNIPFDSPKQQMLLLEYEGCPLKVKERNIHPSIIKADLPFFLIHSRRFLQDDRNLFIAQLHYDKERRLYHKEGEVTRNYIYIDQLLTSEELSALRNANVSIQYPGKREKSKADVLNAYDKFENEVDMRLLILECCSYVPELVFFFLLFSLHWFRPKMAFLDKMCINQNSIEEIRRGVQALPNFLHHSERLVVFWSTTYFTRLWCVYELARFLATHSANQMDFRPLSLCVLMIMANIASEAMFICIDVMEYLEPEFRNIVWYFSMGIGSDEDEMTPDEYNLIAWQLPIPLIIIFVFTVIFLRLLRNGCEAHLLLKSQLQQFSFDRAICANENDRVAIENDLGRWFAEGGLAHTRAFKSIALAIMTFKKASSGDKKTRNKMLELMAGSQDHEKPVRIPLKNRSQLTDIVSLGSQCNGELKLDTSDSTVTTTMEPKKKKTWQQRIREKMTLFTRRSKKNKKEMTPLLLKEGSDLSSNKQRRALELWVRTGVYQDICSFLGHGIILKYKWVMLLIIPGIRMVLFTGMLDPFSPEVPFPPIGVVVRHLVLIFCLLPCLINVMNRGFANEWILAWYNGIKPVPKQEETGEEEKDGDKSSSSPRISINIVDEATKGSDNNKPSEPNNSIMHFITRILADCFIALFWITLVVLGYILYFIIKFRFRVNDDVDDGDWVTYGVLTANVLGFSLLTLCLFNWKTGEHNFDISSQIDVDMLFQDYIENSKFLQEPSHIATDETGGKGLAATSSETDTDGSYRSMRRVSL